MQKTKLTARSVSNFAQTSSERDELWDTEIGGFYIIRLKTSLSFRLKYRNTDGRQRTVTLGRYPAITADQARSLARKATGRVADGEDVQQAKADALTTGKRKQLQTLGAYLDDVYTAYQRRKKSGDGTLAMIRRHFTGWLATPMDGITPQDITRWHAVKESDGLHFDTILRAFGALKTCLNHAVKCGAIDDHQLTKCQLDKPHLSEDALAKTGTSRRYLSAAEIQQFFIGLDGYQEAKRQQRRNSRLHGKAWLPDLDLRHYVDHVVPWFLTMFYTGLRPGDLFGLQWEQVSLANRLITKTIEKTAHHQPKARSFPLSRRVVVVLEKWHGQNGKPTTGYVFPSERTGTRMDKKAMQKPWHKIRELGGLPGGLDLYTLRHNFASQLILAGADLLTVSKLMAHTDIHTTVTHYGHLRPDLAMDYVDRFADTHAPASDADSSPLTSMKGPQ